MVRRQKLTKSLIDATAPSDRDFFVWDGDLAGFGVRIRSGGSKTFVAQYRAGGGRSGQSRRFTIGRYGVMTVEEARELFKAVPSIRDKMETLARVGLGYVHVGQQATTLSGGEAQRVKLSKELSRRSTGRTLYILDEPTTGLHFHDVKKLLEVLHELVDQGNSVVVIEHNLEVIKTADWVIDMGPEGGDGGGEIVAIGTPEEIARNPRSHTGTFLKQVLARRPMAAVKGQEAAE